MLKRGLAAIATLFLCVMLAACGGGSGRQGTDVVVSANGPTDPLPGGASLAFVMTVRNAGDNTAENLTLTNLLSNQLIPSSVTCVASGGAICPSDPSLIMSVPSLPSGGVLQFTVNVQLTANANGSVSNTLTVNVNDDVDRTNNTASFTATAVTSTSNLVVTGTSPGGTITAGSDLAFDVTVRNEGPDAARNLRFVNNTGSFVVFRSVECSATGGGACPPTDQLGVDMSLESLPADATLTFRIHTSVSAGVSGTVTNAFNVTADTDADRSDNSVTLSAQVVSVQDVSVSQSVAVSTAAGGEAVFTAVVTNAAPTAASTLTFTSSLTASDAAVDLSKASITCAAVSGASCPQTLGSSMTLDALPAGRLLTFTITVPLPLAARGSVQSVFSVTAAADADANNNQAEAKTTVFDPRSGSYKLFAADGRQYALNIDFDAGSYTITTGTTSQQRSFTADASGGGYTVSGAQRLRTATDLVVGAHDFGAGVLPYVAARSFGDSVSQVVGSYNLVTRDFVGDVAKTHAAVVSIVGNQMSICQADDGSIKPPGLNCTALGKQRDYLLTAGADNVFTATPATGPASGAFTFYLARSDAAKFIVAAATPASATPALLLALQDAPTLIGGTFQGGSSSGGWIDSLTIVGTTATITGGAADSGSITLGAVPNTGVGSMLIGSRNSDPAQRMWVMQSSPLAVSFGDFLSTNANVAGLLQITVP